MLYVDDILLRLFCRNEALLIKMFLQKACTKHFNNCTPPFPSQSESTLGSIDYDCVKKSLNETKPRRGKYIKVSDEDRFTIGKYAAIHGPFAAVKKLSIDLRRKDNSEFTKVQISKFIQP
jgi:hypothetical protein